MGSCQNCCTNQNDPAQSDLQIYKFNTCEQVTDILE